MRYLPDLLERPQLPIWQLPVAYARDRSRTYTLREIVDGKPDVASPNQLAEEEWRELVLAQKRIGVRYEDQSRLAKYQLFCPEGAVRDSHEAIDQIERRSALGDRIVASSREYLTALLQDVYGGESAVS